MASLIARTIVGISASCFASGVLPAQNPNTPPPLPSKIEPGLEEAVNWKWKIVPATSKEWGMPLPEVLVPKTQAAAAAPVVPIERPATYVVKKGDSISRIAGTFDMSIDQLKQFNALKDDRIVIGQTLRIPTPGELLAMAPPPQPAAKPEGGKKKEKPAEEPAPNVLSYEQFELEIVLMQVFLDREMFSAGAIDGRSGPMFQKVSEIYQKTRPDAADPDRLKAKALEVVKQPYTKYTLRAEDFRFIRWTGDKAAPSGKKRTKSASSPQAAPRVTYQELADSGFLCYQNPWEFVAERFHCDESFLRYLNLKLGEVPKVGSVFKVPNVIPFEIENALNAPLQPAADPANPVAAVVVGLTRLEISQGGKLIAVIPLASARPGLRGRGTWTVLDAIPQPALATRREPRETPKLGSDPATGSTAPVLETDQLLAPGPNNPVGVVWIQLAKAGTNEPLPYGLHGTSIPARMRSLEGIGGFRLTNWDIARVVRLLPAGTGLQWKTQ